MRGFYLWDFLSNVYGKAPTNQTNLKINRITIQIPNWTIPDIHLFILKKNPIALYIFLYILSQGQWLIEL